MKPAAVASVPVSIGKAVEFQAKDAARSRSQPCSSFSTIISTAMIASSTKQPQGDDQGAEGDVLEGETRHHMAMNAIASTSGAAVATMTPERQSRCE